MEKIGYTLNQHIGDGRRRFPEFTDKLSTLLVQMAFSAKILAREFGRSALVGKLGLTGGKNPTGDTQKILDVFSNEIIIEAFAKTGLVAAIVSEELDEVKFLTCQTDARYILCIDPLDGSSNTDINGGIGTIFGIYQRKSGDCPVPVEEFFRKGSDQVAAGYVMYGPGTVLVYTIGHGVHGFTLDHDLGEFLLSHENIRCPVRGVTCSANLARFSQWPPNVQKFVESLTGRDHSKEQCYSLRYAGALVVDLHRVLLEGGVYFYPEDAGHKEGKLRLLYECAPLAFLVEQAGGRASTGTQRILDIQAESIHQRAPLVIGSTEEVSLYEKFSAMHEQDQ